MARLATLHLLAVGGGAMVNISTFAVFEPHASFPVSGSMRAALAGFTKLYADEYAESGIRMNNLLPGFIESYEIDSDTAATIPMGRSGRVAEVAATVAFLLSDGAGYITGQNLRVDGGLTRAL
jgi:NAD(P)-dependent dehydrogenase (short-subunit alcohol dehydrogenase family)